jgi:hypothetical protein
MPVAWGHSVLEPDRGHVREPDTHLVDGATVGFAICGAWLVGDLPPDATFPRCSTCLALLTDTPP